MSPMVLFNILLLIYSFALYSVFGEIPLNINEIDSSLINNAVLDILKSCSRSQRTSVGLLYPKDDLLSVLSSGKDLIIDILIGNKWKNEASIHKLKYIIITASSIETIVKSHDIMKFWNYADKYILIEENSTANHCENAMDFLSDISYHELVKWNVIFICINAENTVMVYALSLIKNKAPTPWKLEPTGSSSQNNYFNTLYMRPFHPNIPCDSLFFDKTRRLNGYNINANVMLSPPWMIFDYNIIKTLKIKPTNALSSDDIAAGIYQIRVSPKDWNLFGGFDGLVMGTISKFLNARMTIKIYPTDDRQYRTSGYFINEMLADLELKAEIGLNNRDVISFIDESFPFIYPIIQREVTIVTNKQGDFSIQRRMARFFNGPIIISIFLIFFLLVLVFRCCVRQRFSPVALNALRFILSINFRYVVTSWSARIFIGCFIPYFLLLFINFQSNTTQIATVARAKPNIDSLDRLNKILNSCKAYSALNFQKYLHLFRDMGCTLNKNDYTNCTDYVLRDSQAVCIDDSLKLMNDVAKNPKLHLTKEPIAKNYASYFITQKWVLQKRFETLLSRLKESGILGMWLTQHHKSPTVIDHRFSKRQFQAISLNQSWSAFVVLLIGLLIATITFIVELLPQKQFVQCRMFINSSC